MMEDYFSPLRVGMGIDCPQLRIPLKFSSGPGKISLGISAMQSVATGEIYEGEYVVTPAVMAQTLPTAKKMLLNDVTVKEIPFFEVSNATGGTTVIIGGDIEIL